MIVCRKNAIWASVRHATDPEVGITQFGQYVTLALKHGAVPRGLTHPCVQFKWEMSVAIIMQS